MYKWDDCYTVSFLTLILMHWIDFMTHKWVTPFNIKKLLINNCYSIGYTFEHFHNKKLKKKTLYQYIACPSACIKYHNFEILGEDCQLVLHDQLKKHTEREKKKKTQWPTYIWDMNKWSLKLKTWYQLY